jgi:hypothetical protein
MPARPELIGAIETIKNTVDQLDDGNTDELDGKAVQDAMGRLTDAANTDAPGCQETQDITAINKEVQGGLLDADNLAKASRIGVRIAAGTIGTPKGPGHRM